MKYIIFLLFIISFSVYGQFDPATNANTIALYRGDSTTVSGSDVNRWQDVSGHSNHVDTTASTTSPALDGDTLVFNGTTDELKMTNFTDFNGNSGSVSIYCKFVDPASTKLLHMIRVDANNNIQFQATTANIKKIYKAGGTEENKGDASVGYNNWHLWTISWDATLDTVWYYKDGSLTERDDALGTWSGTPFIIVGSNDGSLFSELSVTDIWVSDTVRTETEVNYYIEWRNNGRTSVPSSQASGVTFSNVTQTSMTINWTNGGGEGRLVSMKSGSAVDSDPSDGNTYTANSVFGSGDQIGTGNYVVYTGTSNTVNVTGLTAGTVYHVAVYEYNDIDGYDYLLTPATGNQKTLAAEAKFTGWQGEFIGHKGY